MTNNNYYKKHLKEKQNQIDILGKISETISYNWDLKQILGSIVEIVSDYLNSDSCFIYLLNGDNLILQASQNPHKAALGKIKMKIGEGITGWVAKHQEIVVISSRAYDDKRFKFFNMLPEDKFEAFLSVPIVFKDKVVGVINVQHIKRKKYNKDKVKFLGIIARQVGGAIENARLLSETNILKEALETRKLVDRAKAILINKYDISEDKAHKLLHRKSMDTRKSLREVAEAILLAEEITKHNAEEK